MLVLRSRWGNGRSTFTWLDNWHGHGSLLNKYGNRLVYDAASSLNSKLSDYILNGRWNFPHPVSTDMVQVVQNLLELHTSREEDIVEWVPPRNKMFTVAYAKEFIRTHGDRVV
ncbi:hypothetical protein LguiA_026058 [Lonicera macranthoides]